MPVILESELKLKFIFFSLLLVMPLNYAVCAVHTDTHTYILCTRENKLVRIDKKTGEERRIDIRANAIKFVVHGDFGYVLNFKSDSITVVDLVAFKINHKLHLTGTATSMIAYKDKGFILVNDYAKVVVIDLLSHRITTEFLVGGNPWCIVNYGKFGYVASFDSHIVTIFDLETDIKTGFIGVGKFPFSITVSGDYGYVANQGFDQNSRSLSVIDFKTNKVVKTIKLDADPYEMFVHKDKGYLVPKNSELIVEIDLNAKEVRRSCVLPSSVYCPSKIVFADDLAYIKIYKEDVVLDLEKLCVVETISNPLYQSLDATDTHIWFGTKRIKRLNLADSTLTHDTFALNLVRGTHIDSGCSDHPTYRDLLNSAELKVLFLSVSPSQALQLILCLYQPSSFLQTAEGNDVLSVIYQAYCMAVHYKEHDLYTEMARNLARIGVDNVLASVKR